MDKIYKQKWDAAKEYIGERVETNVCLGQYNSHHIQNDLKHFMISMSRYKFVAKMIKYKKSCNVLEIGCGEGLGGRMFVQEADIKTYMGVDIDESAIDWARDNMMRTDLPLEYMVGDVFDERLLVNRRYDVAFSLDVIEHIERVSEELFIKSICEKLNEDGCCVIGTPNITMSEYASETSKIVHINLYTHKRLYELLDKFFENVFMFSMNDEVISTGFEPMACYIFAVGAGLKNR